MKLDKRIERIQKRVRAFDAIRRANAVEMYWDKNGKIAFRRSQ